MFNMMKQMNPESLAIKLAEYLNPNSHDDYTRAECAQLLRKLLTDDDDLCTWNNYLSVSTQSRIKCILLHVMVIEELEFILQEICLTVSKLAASLVRDNNWPELLPFLYQLCIPDSSLRNHLKRSVFHIFRQLTVDKGETMVPRDLHSLFLITLNDDNLDIHVRMAATTAVINFIQGESNSNEKERCQELFPGMMRTVTDPLSKGEEEVAAQWGLEYFIDLAKNEPRFLRMQLVVVVGSMLEIAEDVRLKDWTRGLAVEFLLTLVEARKRTPGMMKRVPLFINRCFAMLLKLLLDIKDDPTWHGAESNYDNTWMTSNLHIGVECLHRFSLALGGKSLAHTALEQLFDYLDDPQREKHHAALVALAKIAKGCSKVMIKNLE